MMFGLTEERDASSGVSGVEVEEEPPVQGEDPAALGAQIERLRAELREAQRATDALKDAVGARDAFIATAGHELRNAMGGVLVAATHLHSQVSRNEDLPPFIVQRLDQIARLSRTFVRRATTLLDVSRLTTTGIRLSRALVSWEEIWGAVHPELGLQADRAGCSLELAIEGGVSGFWDRDAIEQIVVNLVSNAIKFGAKKPVHIDGALEEGEVTLRVRDHGVGISDADRERIFARFERAVRPGDLPGFGLGLWIARQLARAHGGDIHVDSTPGQGSVFTVRLPGVIYPSQR
jgi:two-component system OmpR family sensor kinase